MNGDARKSIPNTKECAFSAHDTLAGTQQIHTTCYFSVVLETEYIHMKHLKRYIVSAT